MSAFFRMICGGMAIMCLLLGCMSNAHWQAVRACKTTCQQRLNMCNSTCYNSCKLCVAQAKDEALRHYNQYKLQQNLQGAATVRELKSYRDPLQCRKTTCECPVDYRACVQSCSGKIPKRLEKAPVC